MVKIFHKMAATGVLLLWSALFLQTTPASALDHVRVGHLPVTGHAKFFVAKEYGIFAGEGIDAELIEFINSADGLNALRAGKLDVAAFGTTAPLVHIAQGADLRIIAGIMGEDAAIIVRAENASSITKISDLKGKKVATVRLATGDAVLRGALDKEGINWKTDLQIFELKNPPAVMEAVKAGEVDAGVTWGPHDITAEKNGLVIAIRSDTIYKGHPCCRLVVTADEAQNRREILTRFVRALLRAQKFTLEKHTETVDAIVKYVKLDRDLIDQAFYHGHLEQSSDPNKRAIKNFWEIMQKSQFISSQLDISSFVDTGIYEEALRGLIKEEPKEQYWVELQKVFRERNI
ncbi:MAG: ABC transporter substrate-binding protein [Syntrophobacteraceae bacterium]|jgi:NitT/TauT family transport system substrate-binding protein